MKQQYCDQCENQCPMDALKCGKGRRHFGLEPADGQLGREMPSGPLGLLMQCGHFLHHGGASSGDPLSALKPQEQAELERLLTVLLTDWKNRMPAEMPHHRHGHDAK